ncbi:MAG: 3-hydroxy-5-phosphonooxypentane-2,4-dione thiolase LsrF, partial [Nitrososphaera sp.]|nr:3-hydroxy-5-phosphonooxypentane-2,4-dione thiolase LsrF [Nitrososphaera sp.]
VPLVVAGGKKLPEMDALKLAYDSVTHGAAGVDMGRNIWQSDYPVPMIKAVKAIVHNKATVKEAYDVFMRERQKMKQKKPQEIVKTVSSSGDFD